jgi:hypothetical protein
MQRGVGVPHEARRCSGDSSGDGQVAVLNGSSKPYADTARRNYWRHSMKRGKIAEIVRTTS